METIGSLALHFDTKSLAYAVKALNDLQRQGQKTGDSLDDAGKRASQGFDKFGNTLGSVRSALAGLGLAALTRQVISIGDEYARVTGQLRLVTDGTGSLAQAQKELFDIAQATRSEYSATAGLYARIARGTKDLGIAQSDLLSITKLTSQAFKISGASAQEAASGMMQFGQAITSGRFAGDELRSISETAPRLFEAIVRGTARAAPALGITTKNFRDLAAQGVITTELITRGLLTQASAIESEFAQLPKTVGDAMTQMEEQVKKAVAGADMKPLIESIDQLRITLSNPAAIEGLTNLAGGLVSIATLAAQAAAGIGGFGEALAYTFAKLTGQTTPIVELEEEIKQLQATSSLTEGWRRRLFAPAEFDEMSNAELQRQIVIRQEKLDKLLGITTSSAERLAAAKAQYDAAVGGFNAAVSDGASKEALAGLAGAIQITYREYQRLAGMLPEVSQQAEKAAGAVAGLGHATTGSGADAKKARKEADELAASIKRLGETYDEALSAVENESNSLSDQIKEAQLLNDLLTRGVGIEEARAQVRRAMEPIVTNEIEAQRDLLDTLKKHNRQLEQEAGLTAKLTDLQQEMGQESAENAKVMEAVYERAAQNIYGSFRDAFRQILDDGKIGFGELKRSISGIFKDLFAELATLSLRNGIASIIGSVTGSAGAGGAGLLSSILGGASGGGLPSMLAGGAARLADFFGASPAGIAQASGIGSALGSAGIAYGAGNVAGSLLAGHGPFRDDTAKYVGTGAAIGSVFGPIGALAGGVVGALASGIIGQWKVKSQDLALDFVDGLADATISTRKKKKRLVGGSKNKRSTDGADSLDDALSDAFGQSFGSAQDAARALGLELEHFTFSVSASIKGLKGAALDAKIKELFGRAEDALASQVLPGVVEFQRENESLFQTLIRVTQEVGTVQQGLGALGLALNQTGQSLVNSAEDLLSYFGGDAGAFSQAAQTFYAAFTPAEQQFDDLTRSLTASLSEVGRGLPATRDGFRALVQGIDATQEADRAALATLLQVSGAADKYYGELERVERASNEAADGLARVSNALRQTLLDVRGSRQLPEARLSDLQAQFDMTYAMALSSSGTTLQAQASKLNDLIGPLVDQIRSVYASGQTGQSLIDYVTRSGDNVLQRLEFPGTPIRTSESNAPIVEQLVEQNQQQRESNTHLTALVNVTIAANKKLIEQNAQLLEKLQGLESSARLEASAG